MNLIANKTLLPLFLSQTFRSLAVSLLSFFSAVYIYKQTSSFLIVFLFFLVLYIFKLIGAGLAENLSLNFGLKKQVIAGQVLTGLTLLGFAASETSSYFLWLAAIFWGLAIGFFWFGRHGLVIKISKADHFGKTIGTFSAGEAIFLLGIPILGGFLTSRFGYNSLFFAAFVLVFLGLLTTFGLKEEKTHKDVKFFEVLGLLLSHPKVALAYLSGGFLGSIYSQALILYVFLNIKKELGFGAFFSLSMILVALANYLIGIFVDVRGKRAFIVFGSVVSSFVWLGRFLASGWSTLLLWDVLDRISGGMTGLPLDVLSFQKALDGRSTGRALLFRETAITLGSILATLFLIVLVLVNLPLKFAFLLAVPFSLGKLLIVKKDGVLGENEKTG